MRGYLKRLFQSVPAPLVDWAKIAYDWIPPSLRYGKSYSEGLALFVESDHWDEKKLVEYQENLLRRLIAHSYEHVPYYRQIFDQADLKPQDIVTVADLRRLPFLTKKIVRERKTDLLADNSRTLRMEPCSTSGTTGPILDFQIDRCTRAMERALALRQLLWLGYQRGDLVAELKEDSFADPNRTCRYFPVSRQLRFSFFNINEFKLQEMFRVLERFRPAFIKGFPSCLYILSRWMERNKKQVPSPRYVLTSSENLYPSIKKLVERVFQAPVVDHYGQNEQVAYAFQCATADQYHIQMEYCVLELVPAWDGSCEIVGTNLHNLGMPFIRYRTGDLAVPGEGPCPCGRELPTLSQPRGRATDIIITPERNIISWVAIDYALDHLEEIKDAQIIQEDINTLRVKLVPWEPLSQEMKGAILRKINSYLNSRTMTVTIEEVQEIARTKRGKKPFIISRIKIDDYM